MNNNFKGWHVLCVKPFHERKIYALLLESSINAFLPLVETVRRWSDRKKIILKPLFPSYIFVNLDSSLDFYKALDLQGAFTYISFGGEYAKVPDDEINKIKLLVGAKEITEIEMNVKTPKIGEIKKISFGSLKGLECKILKVNNASKIIVRIDSLQQNITATIPSFYFEKEVKVVS